MIATVLLCVVSLGLCVVVDGNNHDKFIHHVGRLKRENFTCGTPQKRALSFRDIVGDREFFGKYDNTEITPSGSILYRCENSGCCEGPNDECQVMNSTVVKLWFVWKNKYIFVETTNHTHCGCAQRQKGISIR